ncbi:MAG: hypothetical protein RL754_117 [Bacteroidota bacterium]|jgi:thiol-disulfide isomerase/thioredoxin
MKVFKIGAAIAAVTVAGLMISAQSGTEQTGKASYDIAAEGTNIGDMAPDFEQMMPDGSTMKLSDLRGQLVLIDFWASWCGPCRRENPNVVKAYQEYKDKKYKNGNGFTVFSVSLDQDKGRWIKAIETDKLDWEYHVSDLQGWSNAAAAKYGVRSIPASFLVDGDGRIIAKNLRGATLEATLSKLIK